MWCVWCSGGGRIYRPPSRCQTGEPGGGDAVTEHRTGGSERTGVFLSVPVRLVLRLQVFDIGSVFQDSGGWTPVIWAAEHRHIDVIRALLNRGADVTLRDKVSL